jgi:hypothetical protein
MAHQLPQIAVKNLLATAHGGNPRLPDDSERLVHGVTVNRAPLSTGTVGGFTETTQATFRRWYGAGNEVLRGGAVLRSHGG